MKSALTCGGKAEEAQRVRLKVLILIGGGGGSNKPEARAREMHGGENAGIIHFGWDLYKPAKRSQ